MVSTPRSRRLGVAAVASIAALGLAFSAPAQASTQPQPHPLAAKAKAAAPDRTVTLITGDKVILQAFTTAPSFAARSGGDLAVSAYGLTDADGNSGFAKTDSESSKLLKDGQVVAESPYFGYVEATGLPAGKTSYTLESSQTRQTYSTFSTRMDLRWTFSSAATTEETPLPLLGVRYQPVVDSHNTAERKPVTVLPVLIDAQPGATVPGIKKLEIQVSGDGGKTWHPAGVVPSVHGAYKAIFATPNGATISLKSHLLDAKNNTTDLTVINAYPVR